jgi:hypothetical protein
MATDVTALLIQMMTAGSSENDGYAVNSSVFDTSADLLSGVANWAQILGTALGPVGQAATASIVANIAAQQAAQTLAAGATVEAAAAAGSQAGADAALGVTAATAGVVAVIVVAVAGILTLVGGDGSTSTQSQEYTAFLAALGLISDQNIIGYWTGKITALNDYWNTPGGHGPEVYLNDLASQGTGGNHVKGDVSDWHGASFAFIFALTTVVIGQPSYWEVLPEPGYAPQQAGFEPADSWWNGGNEWQEVTWYGEFPARLRGSSPGGALLDPTTMLPVLALAIHSDLALESLANLVDSSQPTLHQFLSQYGSSFTDTPGGFLDFFYSQYSSAVNGIAMTDVPSPDQIVGYLWTWVVYGYGLQGVTLDTNPDQDPNQSWAAPDRDRSSPPAPAFAADGYCWTGLYGAAAAYPQYGFFASPQTDDPDGWPHSGGSGYQFSAFTSKNLFTPEYIVSFQTVNDLIAKWQQANVLFTAGGSEYVSTQSLYDWVAPWLQNRIILARMARWKAIYLIDSYDKVWAILQTLQRITKPDPPIVPSVMTFQDNTGITYAANGNWSVRELISVVKISNSLLAGVGLDPTKPFVWGPASSTVWQPVTGYSVEALAQLLHNVADGDWGGPPSYAEGEGPVGPFSLRGLLAAIAT